MKDKLDGGRAGRAAFWKRGKKEKKSKKEKKGNVPQLLIRFAKIYIYHVHV